MLSGGAEESTEKASQDFQGQKVSSRYVVMKLGRCLTCYSNSAFKQAFLFSSFLLDRLLQYERIDEDSSGRC